MLAGIVRRIDREIGSRQRIFPVIDNKSEDRTREIAQKMGAKVFEYVSEDFSELRNIGLKTILVFQF